MRRIATIALAGVALACVPACTPELSEKQPTGSLPADASPEEVLAALLCGVDIALIADGVPFTGSGPECEDEEPVAEEPVDEEPVDEEPVDEEPVEEEPVSEEPVDEEPVSEEPVEEVPVGEGPVEEVPVEEVPVEEVPVVEVPVDEAPVDEAPVGEVPVGEGPVDEVPVEEVPVDEVPVVEAPVDEVPVVEVPVEEPVEEPAADGKVVAAVPFDGRSADPFEGLRVGDSGFRQWSDDGPNTFEIVEFEGESYGRARIEGGPHGNDIRAEGIVAGDSPDSTLKFADGDEYWFGDTIVIGEGFPDRFFNNVLQWKNDGTGSAPLFLGAWDGQMQLRGSFGNRAVGEIDEGVSHRYVIGVGFDSGAGWVEVYRDGELVLDRTEASTLRRGTESYAKVGYYRGDEITGTGSVLHRDLQVGTTRGSVD